MCVCVCAEGEGEVEELVFSFSPDIPFLLPSVSFHFGDVHPPKFSDILDICM